jgi:peptide/nickel transport system permease protein
MTLPTSNSEIPSLIPDLVDGNSQGVGRPTGHYEMRLITRSFRKDTLALIGAAIIVLFVLGAVFAPLLTPYPDQGKGAPNILEKFQPPGSKHLLGTDYLGRDVLTRLLFGGRSSLGTGFLVVFIAVVIGTPLGAIAGYYGGWIDETIMRITDLFLAFPSLLLALAIAAALGSGFINTMIAISITWWPWYTRLVRAQTISLRERFFVEAARSIGVSNARIISTHILSNVTTPIIVQATMDLGSAILIGAALNFIGLGVQPPMADWGNMISQGRIYFIERPWFAGSAGLAIFLVALSFNFVGDALRDASDPYTRRA